MIDTVTIAFSWFSHEIRRNSDNDKFKKKSIWNCGKRDWEGASRAIRREARRILIEGGVRVTVSLSHPKRWYSSVGE